MMHSGQERLHALNIEYIHIGACLGYIQDIFIEALMGHPHLSTRRKVALIRALTKVIWIQNDMFAKWQVRNGEEFADEMSMYSYSSQEGYLGDKKILGSRSSVDDDHSSTMSSVAPSVQTTQTTQTTTSSGPASASASATKESVCPFAALKGSSTQTKIWAD